MGNVYIFFLESQKMDFDFIASILIRCHKIKGCREIFLPVEIFCQNLLNEASDSQFYDLPQIELHWNVLQACHSFYAKPEGTSYAGLKHFFLRPDSTHFLFKASWHFLCSFSAQEAAWHGVISLRL